MNIQNADVVPAVWRVRGSMGPWIGGPAGLLVRGVAGSLVDGSAGWRACGSVGPRAGVSAGWWVCGLAGFRRVRGFVGPRIEGLRFLRGSENLKHV